MANNVLQKALRSLNLYSSENGYIGDNVDPKVDNSINSHFPLYRQVSPLEVPLNKGMQPSVDSTMFHYPEATYKKGNVLQQALESLNSPQKIVSQLFTRKKGTYGPLDPGSLYGNFKEDPESTMMSSVMAMASPVQEKVLVSHPHARALASLAGKGDNLSIPDVGVLEQMRGAYNMPKNMNYQDLIDNLYTLLNSDQRKALGFTK